MSIGTAYLLVAIIGAVSLQASILLTYLLNRRNRAAQTAEIKAHVDTVAPKV